MRLALRSHTHGEQTGLSLDLMAIASAVLLVAGLWGMLH